MILDAETRFSNAQAISADAVGTNVIDLSLAKSLGSGEPMAVLFTVDVAADQTTGDEDYTFDVEHSTDAAQTTGRQLIGRRVFESGTPTAPAQDADLLVAGFQLAIVIPPITLPESARYLGIRYDVAGTSPTITVTAHLLPLNFIQKDAIYPDAITIS